MNAKPTGPVKALQVLSLLWRVAVTRGEEQLRHGQRFLQATETDTFQRGLRMFLDRPECAALAQRRPDSLALLRDRATLLACPPGSLGRHYVDFLAAHGMDESYYTRTPLPETLDGEHNAERRWLRARLEYTHDVRHVIAGYSPDEIGEICLLIFRFGQIGHRGALLLGVLGLLHNIRHCGAVLEAFGRGRRARLLDLLPWEDRLAEPLSSLRAEVGLEPTRRYPAPYAPEAYIEAPSSGGAA